ncbi:hypothetical protein [Vibrio sp. TBV020]|uniref:hypothetical protein n=1 Tax=Vibrio sp. TBV020 TaxID=3137398 RepID=UPI0038CD9269
MLKFFDFVSELGFEVPKHLSFLASDPKPFQYAQPSYSLEEGAKQRIHQYLSSNVWTRASYGALSNVDIAIAFSFGDSDDVNVELATQVERVFQCAPQLDLYLQQEVACHVKDIPYISIKNAQYQTTTDVARYALNNHGKARVLVIAQSWHAQRCIDTCEELGLNVVALRVVDGFPSQDPQPWVRNPINWIIKESFRDEATGYEISERFNLV